MTRQVKDRIAAIEEELADVGKVDRLREFVEAKGDRPQLGRVVAEKIWKSLSTERQRTVISTVATVTILPVRQGSHTFHPDSVVITAKHHSGS